MKKIGRNERCPCKSGKKYKHCCALKPKEVIRQITEENQLKVTLTMAVQGIQQAALKKEKVFEELGVFLLFATVDGDAWLLETTESDCVQVAMGGEILPLPFDEGPDTIELDWSHTYSIIDKQFVITSYKDKTDIVLHKAPSKEVHAAAKRIRKKLSPEMISQVHVKTSE